MIDGRSSILFSQGCISNFRGAHGLRFRVGIYNSGSSNTGNIIASKTIILI